MLVWRVTSDMIKAKPLLGHGYDGFKSEYMNYQEAHFRNNLNVDVKDLVVADNINYAFNEPLQFVAENGLIGGAFVLLVLLFLFRIKNNSIMLISQAGLISVMVFSLFSYPTQILPIKLNAVLYLSVMSGFSNQILGWKASRVRHIIKVIVTLFLLTFVILSTRMVGQLYKAFQDWDTAISLYETRNYSDALIYYKRSFPALQKNGDFMMQYGKALSVAGVHKLALHILHKAQRYSNNTVIQIAMGDSYAALKQYNKAERAYINAWYMSPNKFYPKYLLAKLYFKIGNKRQATKIAKDLLKKKVKIESLAIQQIQVEMRKIIKEASD